MGNHHQKLTLSDRSQINQLVKAGEKQKDIAIFIGVDPSTISRELRRKKIDGTRMDRYSYDIAEAQCSANQLKENSGRKKKIVDGGELHTKIKAYIIEKRWSPEQISGRLRLEDKMDRCIVSHETIYQYIYSIDNDDERQQWIQGLRHKRKRRRPWGSRLKKRGQIKNAISIHQRPKEVEDRKIPGHWEGDLIIGANHSSAVGTIVERTSRFSLIFKIHGRRTSENVIKAFASALSKIPKHLRKSMTYDNGLEMAEHDVFTKLTGMPVYFADVGTPSQRGTNENTNGLARDFHPKKTNFNHVSDEELKRTEQLLNERPRKCIGFRTPSEYLQYLSLSRAPPGNKKDSNPGN